MPNIYSMVYMLFSNVLQYLYSCDKINKVFGVTEQPRSLNKNNSNSSVVILKIIARC